MNWSNNMKIIFFGNCIFTAKAVKCLLRYKKNYVTLVSYKDSPDYCVKRALPSFSKKKNFKYIEFDTKKDDELEIIKKDKYDILISCAWNHKFSDEILNIISAYNFHASMLPKYRGATPLQSQLKNGDKIGGVTMHLMTQQYDSGPIYKQIPFKISKKETLDTIAMKASKNMCKILKKFLTDYPNIELMEQNEYEATYC